jgi:hypothetical protein
MDGHAMSTRELVVMLMLGVTQGVREGDNTYLWKMLLIEGE